jgi:hypothetical protein
MKKTISIFVALFCLVGAAASLGQEKTKSSKAVVETGSLDVYIGYFLPPDYPLTAFAPVDGVIVKLISQDRKAILATGVTNLKGYVRIEGIEPGKVLIAVDTGGGEYLLKNAAVVIPKADESKVFLHIEQENNFSTLRADVEKMGVLGLLPNLRGKLIEVSKSRAVASFENTAGKETKKEPASEKAVIKKSAD